MSVLIDTSVWVDHFKKRNDILVDLLEKDLAQGHPVVLAELACATSPYIAMRGPVAILPSGEFA